MSVSIQWLGANGFYIRSAQGSILIDPYFSRVPFIKMWFGKVKPDVNVIKNHSFPSDAILVSHAHVDHLLDVPVIARDQAVPVYGSYNTCRILACMEVPQKQIHPLHANQELHVNGILITAIPASHIYTPGFLPGSLPEDIHPPLRARQYIMDEDYAFLIQTDGLNILTDPGRPLQTDVHVDTILLFPFHPPRLLQELLSSIKPEVVIPSHWDDFFRPLSRPVTPMWLPPQKDLPPIRRADLQVFARQVEKILPGTKVVQLDRFEEMELPCNSQ